MWDFEILADLNSWLVISLFACFSNKISQTYLFRRNEYLVTYKSKIISKYIHIRSHVSYLKHPNVTNHSVTKTEIILQNSQRMYKSNIEMRWRNHFFPWKNSNCYLFWVYNITYNKPSRWNSGSIVFIKNYKYALHVSDALCVHLQEHYKL